MITLLLNESKPVWAPQIVSIQMMPPAAPKSQVPQQQKELYSLGSN